MAEAKRRPNYLLVWVWLVILAVGSVLFALFLPRGAALLLIFAAAWIKAALVALNYMHLKYEKWQLYALVGVPLLLVTGLLLTLFPDIVWSHGGLPLRNTP